MRVFVLFISLVENSQSDVYMTAAVTGGVAVVVVLIIAGASIVVVVLVLRYHRRNDSTDIPKYDSFNSSNPMHYTLQNVPNPIYIIIYNYGDFFHVQRSRE